MPGQLFTNYFLEEGILRTHAWQESLSQPADFESFRAQAQALLENAAAFHTINEAATEQELIRPLFDLLGWADYLPQQGSDRNEDIPDHLLFADAESKDRATAKPGPNRYPDALAVSESKRFDLSLDDRDLCAADSNTRRSFANDLLNLTLASPSVNRHQKVDKDVAEWLPALNACWYVNQVVLVKRKYNLTMDQAEAAAAQRVLDKCPKPIVIIFTDPGPAPPPEAVPPAGPSCPRNCTEAHEMGMSNMRSDHACYQTKFDRDGDGIACER